MPSPLLLPSVDQRLFDAIVAADTNALRQALADGANPNVVGLRGRTPLHAATENHVAYHRSSHQSPGEVADAVVRLLVKAGAQPDAQDRRGNTPLHAAVRFGFHPVIRRFVSLKVDVNRLDSNSSSPLYAATQNHDHRAMVLLLKHGAQMNQPLKPANDQTLWDWARGRAEREGRGPDRETFTVLERFELGMSALFAPLTRRARARVRL